MTPHLSIARWIEEYPVAANAIVVSLLSAVTVAMMAGFGVTAAIGAALLAAPVFLRISHPFLAAVLVGVAALVATAVLQAWPVTVGMWAVPMVVHRVAARCQRSARLGILALALSTGLLIHVISPRWAAPVFTPTGIAFGSIDWWMIVLLLTPMVWLTVISAYLLGDIKRVKWEREVAQAQRAQALSDRAEALAAWAHRLEIERDQEVRLAAQDERTRIAREMHDVVAHSLSVVITQADGARYAAAADPRVASETLDRIATAARGSLTEMRRLLGVLRTDDGRQITPVPEVDDLPALIDSVRQAGLPVELRYPAPATASRAEATHDAAPKDVATRTHDNALTALPAGASLAIYRLVQEALTNVLKHAPGATAATVQIRTGPSWVEAVIVNDGLLVQRAHQATTPMPSSGQGLLGLAERLGVYGGQIQAGPIPENPDRWVIRGWVRTPQDPGSNRQEAARGDHAH